MQHFAGFRLSYFTEQHLEDLVPNLQWCKMHKDTAAGVINNYHHEKNTSPINIVKHYY